MVSEIVIDVGTNETRAALLEEQELVEIYIEKSEHARLVGNIYRGKVSNVLPGMQAAFIDIGYEKNAFLYAGDAVATRYSHGEDIETFSYESGETSDDINSTSDAVCSKNSRDTKAAKNNRTCTIEDLVRVGQEITVQVIKEPFGTKGPRVTAQLTLPGRHLVLLPNADYIGISRRIEDEEERKRLKSIAENLKPTGMGLIVRTAAEGIGEEEFERDIHFLEKLWEKIKKREKSGPIPRIIHKDENLIYRVVRDLFISSTNRLVVNDRLQYEKVLELVEMISPSLKKRVEYYSKEYNIFDFYDIESKIQRALSRKVWLKCGGYIIIEQTEALTVIDVNTGKFVGGSDLEDTVVRTNIDAAREIAKQLRLRDIGGIIIIDFIDMNISAHQSMVLEALRVALKRDRTRTTVVGITGLGLVEMTRKKVRQTLSSIMHVTCPYCDGTGKTLIK